MKTSLFAIGLLLLAGCAVGPDFETPQAPKADVALMDGDDRSLPLDNLKQWWGNFQDATLTQLIERGLKASPTIEIALHNLRSAHAARVGLEGDYWPQFSANGGYTWSRSMGGSTGNQGWQRGLSANATANWEIDIFGGVRRSVEQAEAKEAQLAYTLQDLRVALAADIANAYIDLRCNQIQYEIVQSNLKLQERNLEIAQKRYDAQVNTRYDVATAKAQLATTSASLPEYRDKVNAALLQLDLLLGAAPYTTKQLLAETLDTMVAPDARPTLLTNELLRRRADIRAAEAGVHASTAVVGMRTAELYPKFMLSGTVGVSAPDFTPMSSYSRSLSLGPSASWNIFGFGTLRKQVDAAKEDVLAAIATYKQTVLTAYQEAETAWISSLEEARRAAPLAEAERQHIDACQIAEKLYKEGEVDYADVLSQQSGILSIQSTLANHRANLLKQYVALYKALGGGWTDDAAEARAKDEPLLSAIEL